MGQPDVQLRKLPDGLWQVEVNGFDYFDTAKGELVSGGKTKIAACGAGHRLRRAQPVPAPGVLPMAGKDEGWMKLKKDIRAELDEDLLEHFSTAPCRCPLRPVPTARWPSKLWMTGALSRSR
jgi:adenine-specific DNA-methyltransferase